MNRCFSCFKEYEEEFDVCPFCGEIRTDYPKEPIHLYPGTVLAERYIIGQAVNSGGFGIIYKAWDSKLETIVAVKEFFANRLVTRAEGEKRVIVNQKTQEEFEYRKVRFLAEARNMAKFGGHRSIPNVFEFFEENDTAYIVMELLNGMALNEYLMQKGGSIDKEFAIVIANEVGNALISLHEKGIIHRDVAPDNIYICSDKEIHIKLLDLGAAKLADTDEEVRDIIVKPGYSPVEQYNNTKNIGAWSDVYALGASLYVMLTGIKPDESTDRKVEDKVVPPHILDERISINLSNAIMKAMAIEKHMRFKNVADFLKAINGEKKVISLEKERKHRKRRRFSGIVAACLLLAIVGVSVSRSYSLKKEEQMLKPATITMWISVSEGSEEPKAIETIKEDFRKTFTGVEIEIREIEESQYQAEIEKAIEEDTLPTLFESTGLSKEDLSNASEITNVLKSEQADNCLFLEQYENYYDDHKQLPLAIEVPMAFVITNGVTSVNYTESTFSSLSDFGTDVKMAVDSKQSDFMEMNFEIEGLCGEEEFLNNQANTCAIMLSSSMSMNQVRETLTNYQKSYVFYDSDEVKSQFTYEWSIGEGNKDEIKAAERLLSWMLGNAYQNTLMISQCSDGQIPINMECFMEKISQRNYTALDSIYERLVFER